MAAVAQLRHGEADRDLAAPAVVALTRPLKPACPEVLLRAPVLSQPPKAVAFQPLVNHAQVLAAVPRIIGFEPEGCATPLGWVKVRVPPAVGPQELFIC